jgi:hypothetical protein
VVVFVVVDVVVREIVSFKSVAVLVQEKEVP